MLRLRLDYLPLGSVQGTQLLGELLLTNDGTGTLTLGNYDVSLRQAPPEGQVDARVEHFPRALGAWALVQAAFVALEEQT